MFVESSRAVLCFEISSFLFSAAALLSIPGFVERLCKLATRKVSESTGTASFLQELEEWYTWLDNALVLDALMRVANEESEHSQGTWGGELSCGFLEPFLTSFPRRIN